ncbi:MAG: FAD-dependent oxidoreductase, partial [Minicystis sp.]
WWSSFVDPYNKEGGSASRALKIASFCYGEEEARWKISPSGSTRSNRIYLCSNGTANTRKRGAVTIFGAGIAGLTAAHELAERGFSVVIVEANPPSFQEEVVQVGGLARTQWSKVAEDETDPRLIPLDSIPPLGSKDVFPGEHGYRFFPSFYRHVFDTMKRTPIVSPGPANGTYPTALDQLQPTFQQVFAQRSSAVPLSRTRPRSLEAFRREYMSLIEGLGFERRDLARFFFKLVRYLTTCSARRAAEYENKTFLDFLGGESYYSKTFLGAIKAAPQALVAMDANVCDARTQGNVYLQLLMDQVLGGEYTDGTLRGPTSTAWFLPWRNYLDKLDVKFLNAKLLSIRHNNPKADGAGCPDDRGMEVILELTPSWPVEDPKAEERILKHVTNSDFYVMALDAVAAEQTTSGWDSTGVPSELRGFSSHLEVELQGRLDRYDVSLPFPMPRHRQRAEEDLRRLLRRIRHEQENPAARPVIRSALRSLTRATGELLPCKGDSVEEIRVSLWFQRKIGLEEVRLIEQTLTNWVPEDQDVRLTNSTPDWLKGPTKVRTPRLPEQVYGDDARDRFQTFTGIQYYFEHDFKLVRGHVYFPDTEWGLSAISQGQFWWHSQSSLPKEIRGILSVDIGACRSKSSYTGKTLVESTSNEIYEEVWRQIKSSLRTTRGTTSLVTSLPLPEPRRYHLDQNLVMGIKGLQTNRTPFLINNAGDWDQRPRCMPWVPGESKFVNGTPSDGTDVWQAPYGGYRVHCGQVVFCGHYMRTFTRMTTMESANESARHAVNAILDYFASTKREESSESGGSKPVVSGDYCQIWDIEQNELEDLAFFKRIDEMLFKAGKPHMADILRFDESADLQHPNPTSGQALATALGVTAGKDWGVQPGELVSGLNGLVDVARKLGKDLGGAYSGEGSPLAGLLSLLTNGKGGTPGKS